MGPVKGEGISPPKTSLTVRPVSSHMIITYKIRNLILSFFCRFTDDAFDAEQAATIGVDFKVKTITINGDKVSGYKFSKFCPCFINIMKNNCVHRIN